MLGKVRQAQAGPTVLTVKMGLEVGAFSLICQMFTVFHRSDRVISTLETAIPQCIGS